MNAPDVLYIADMPIKNPFHTAPFLSLHALVASRGDGLRSEFVTLFSRMAHGADPSLSETLPAPVGYGYDVGRDQESGTQGQAIPKNADSYKD